MAPHHPGRRPIRRLNPSPLACLLALAAGGLLLAWPAGLNGYPLVFIDTFTYLRHTTEANPPWDKTLVYGPLVHAFHWQWSLWPPMLAQVFTASWLLWLTQRGLRGSASPTLHVLICALLAAGTAAPWFLTSIMPDAFTAQVVLCLFLLGFTRLSGAETLAVILCATLAIGVHLTHLASALALLGLTLLLRRRLGPCLRVAAPVLLAMLLIAGSNLASFGRFALSPHGAIFLLGRLQQDGPALALMQARCPAQPPPNWRLCGLLHWLPMDSDDFLWGISPLHNEADGTLRPDGTRRAVPEAQEIVAATLRAYPADVARSMLANVLRQLGKVEVGDTLPNAVFTSTREVIAAGFAPRSDAAFRAGLQNQGLLPEAAAPFLAPHWPVLLLALALWPLLLWRAFQRRDLPRAALLLFALVALAANATTTGALSKPHHRYQARLVWLLPAAVALALLPRQQPRRG